ncbi:hypothetical protein [Algibacillus agarilyticus]|uniref:hypothetical protein n=1 Tax=Algibacillus agarilyticus TaxID=2234133 RepID=UPI000DD05BF7|nr:hypothetical protein [Algibacillus agarilyticus]
MNNMFPITNKTAQTVWNNFDRELIHKLKPLPSEEQSDIRLEILSHLYDAMSDHSSSPNETEEIKLINAISNLGSPDEYLTPLIADILLYQNASKGYPSAILQGLKSSAKKGLMHAFATFVLGMGYFWTIMIFIMAFMHIINPDIGIWYYPTGDISLSFEAQPNAQQWLPTWFSLIGISGSALAYWGLNKVLSYFIARLSKS